MSQAPHARLRFHRLGMRMLAAGMLVASLAAVALVVMHLPAGGSTAPKTPVVSPPANPWGVTQAGYRQIDASVTRALQRLPVHIRLPSASGRPAGVYTAPHSIRVRYAQGSHYGVYLLTVWRARYGVGPRAIRARASGCHACTHNRLVLLARGVHGAVASGGGHPSTVTWREHGRTYQVRGPASTFANSDAVAAARAIARANA